MNDDPKGLASRRSTGIRQSKSDNKLRLVEEETMKKDLGILQAVYPMPVLMIVTYDEDGKVDVMNAAGINPYDFDLY